MKLSVPEQQELPLTDDKLNYDILYKNTTGHTLPVFFIKITQYPRPKEAPSRLIILFTRKF